MANRSKKNKIIRVTFLENYCDVVREEVELDYANAIAQGFLDLENHPRLDENNKMPSVAVEIIAVIGGQKIKFEAIAEVVFVHNPTGACLHLTAEKEVAEKFGGEWQSWINEISREMMEYLLEWQKVGSASFSEFI